MDLEFGICLGFRISYCIVNEIPPKELRFKRGTNILNYIRQFSATEKVIFSVFVGAALVTAIIMVGQVSDYFSKEVPAYGGSIREGVVGLPRNINPILAITDVDRDLCTLVYSGLMKYADGKIVPDIAKSYSISSDGLTYTFKLKSGVDFQDGNALTAEDIAFTIQKIQDPAIKSPRRVDWAEVVVKVVSPTEIQFILKQPYSPFLANTTIGIIPKHIWESISDEQFIFSQYNIEPVGSGSYKVNSVVRDNGGIPTQYKLSTWRSYYNKEPFIPSIIFNFFSDETEMLSALNQGSIDSAASISPESAAKLSSNNTQNYKILSAPLPHVFGVFFNQNQSPVLMDKVVRQALDMSIDRNELINQVLKGYGSPISGPTPFLAGASNGNNPSSGSVTSTGSSKNSSTMTAVNSAQILLEKNGWKKGADDIYAKKIGKTNTSMTLSFDIYTADSPDLKQAAELVRDTWNRMGAHVTVKVYEPNDLYQNIIRPRKYDALLFGEVIGKDRDLYAFWHSSQLKSPGLNIAQYANSKTDKLLEDIRATSNEDLRVTKYAQFDQLIRDDIPATFLYMPNFIYVVPKAINNIEFGTMNIPADRWSSVANWYEKTEKVWGIFTK